MAKNGIKKTADFFKPMNKPVKKAANMTDHHGKNRDNIIARTKVDKKFLAFLFMALELKIELK